MVDAPRPDPAAPWPVTFTEQFVAHVRGLLDVRPVLAIIGPVGGNRNLLAATVVDAPDGAVRWRHIARYGDRDRPYFAARQILLSLHVDPDDGPVDVEAAAVEALRDSGLHHGTLVLGNADLCDQESLSLMARLAVRGEIKVVVTATPETVSILGDLLPVAETVELRPLDASTIAEVLRLRFGLEPHPSVIEVLLERSEGTYGVVQELTDAAWAAGALHNVDGVLVVDADDAREATPRLASLTAPRSVERLGGAEEVRTLLDLTAVVGHLDAGEARRSVGARTVDEAVAHGALREVDGALTLTTRTEAAQISRAMTQERLTALFESYAHHLPSTVGRTGNAVRCADWWRSAGQLLPVDLAARAAREANLTGRYRRALVFSDATANVDGALVAPLERAFALVEVGDRVRLQALFTTIDPSTLTENELLPYLRWVDRFVPEPERGRLLQLATGSGPDGVNRRRRAVRTLAGLFEQVFNDIDSDTESTLRSLAFSDRLSPANRAMTFATLSAAQRHTGQPAQAVRSAAFALEILASAPDTVSAFQLNLAHEFHILALISAVDMPRADAAVRAYVTGPFDHTGSARMGTTLRGILELFRGDMQQALVNARLSLAELTQQDPRQVRGWTEAMLAQVLVQCGRDDEARSMVLASTAHPSQRRQHDLERRLALACAHDALAEPEEALRILADVVTEAHEHGLTLARIDAAVLGVQIGGPAHLEALTAAVGDLVDPSGTPAIWQEFARLAQAHDIDGMIDQAERLDLAGAQLFAAEVAQYTLDIARRSSDLDDAQRVRLVHLADPVSQRQAMRPR